MSRVGARLLLTLCCAAAPSIAHAGAATDTYDDIKTGEPIGAHAIVDFYGLYNFNQPADRRNQFREFDFRSGQPSVGLTRLTLAHHPHWLGFRADLVAGDATEAFFRSDPAALLHPEFARWMSHVEQLFVSATIPVGRGIDLDLGKFGSPIGYENNESIKNWNYSRGLLYSFAEPSLHTGTRLSFHPTSRLTTSLYLVNGWNTFVLEGNGMRSFGAAITYDPRDRMEFSIAYMAGPERSPRQLGVPILAFRNVVNATASYSPVQQLSLTLAGDYGTDEGGNGATWYGVAGYARVQARPWLAMAFRTEFLADPQGLVTGVRQTIAETTTTLELERDVHALRFLARLEYRHDQSTAFVFEHDAHFDRSGQDTLTLALLGSL